MRWRIWLVGGIVFAAGGRGQTPEPQTSSQIRIQFALGQHLAEDLERRDGRIVDPAMVSYLQGLANRLTGAAKAKTMEVRVTRSSDTYANLVPNGVLYLSATLFERTANEAEIAGLFAHQIAHLKRGAMIRSQTQNTIPTLWPACVLAAQIAPSRFGTDRQEIERESTRDAVETLRLAAFDPSGLLDLLSKLAFEYPAWAKAIVADDLLELRAVLENEVPPQHGYSLDSSDFVRQHARAVELMGHADRKAIAPALSEPRQ